MNLLPSGRFTGFGRAWQNLALATVLMAHSVAVTACPGYLYGFEPTPSLSGSRAGLRLFSWQSQSKRWETLPLQLDPEDDNGQLQFFKDEAWRRGPIAKTDRLSFAVDRFGSRGPVASMPCKGSQVYELSDAEQSNHVAYLTVCNAPPPSSPIPPQVRYDPVAHKLESPRYTYRFNADNQMLFDEVWLKGSPAHMVVSHSDLTIHADLRRFFAMTFGAGQIESYLENTREGPLGTVADVAFYLHILFFHIKLALVTDVSFFADSAHIPMTVTLPSSASHYLLPGSGILYTWRPAVNDSVPVLEMPRANPSTLKKPGLAEIGLPRCRFGQCDFRLALPSATGQAVTMDFSLREGLVRRGFFPQYVPDVSAFSSVVGWSKAGEGKREGLYFETSGLADGASQWDFWLRLGDGATSRRCPHPIALSRVN